MEGATDYLTRELIFVIYKELRIQEHGDAVKIDVVKIGLQRQALKRTPPFAGRNDGAIGPFIGRFWLQIWITARMRGNYWRGSCTPRIKYRPQTCTVYPAE